MDVRKLRAFQAICATGSFSAAAENLYLTQSALSHQIKLLEEELGQALLVRARPKAYPTAAGRMLLESAEIILSEMRQIRERLGVAAEPGPRPLLRIASTNIGLCYLYGGLCEAFMRDRPDVDLVIHATESTEDAVGQVSRRFADMAFATLPVAPPELDVTALGSAEQIFVVGQGHALAKMGEVEVDALADAPMVRFLPGSGMRAMSDALFAKAGRHPPVLTESNDTEVVKRLVAMGRAVALLPVFAAADEIRSGRLIPLRVKDERMEQGFGVVTRAVPPTVALSGFKRICQSETDRWPSTITLEHIVDGRWPAV